MDNKKYQIFISSTYRDLRELRVTVFNKILNMGNIPVGMEQFSASPTEQFEYIMKQIDNCDYFVLIIGKRYGSICERTGLSYTEMEYDYAVKKNIPILAFPCRNALKRPSKEENIVAFSNFINKIKKGNLVKEWNNKSGIAADVVLAINQALNDFPRLGWIRGIDEVKRNPYNETSDYIINYYPQISKDTNENWYEKYKSGKIRQGGRVKISRKSLCLTFLTPFRTNKYAVSLECIDKSTKIYATDLTTTSMKICCDELIKSDKAYNVSWMVEGF